jgi:hypothetical protein
MKTTLRIPTDQYAFIEVELESQTALEPWEVRMICGGYMAAFKAGEGIHRDDFNRIFDELRLTGKVVNGVEFWEKMSPAQQQSLQELKKSLKRSKQ